MAFMLMALVSALSVASVAAQTASIAPLEDAPSWQQNSAMSLLMTAPGANIVPLTYNIYPLTAEAGLNQTDVARTAIHIRGNLVSATQTSYVNINSSDSVAYLCCDNPNSSFITPNVMLATLMNNKPRAILLYSMIGNCCSLQGVDLPYRSIFTMSSSGEATEALNITDSGDGVVQAFITGNATTPSQDSQNSQNGNNSAVAMSILYSITGLITLLFLVIIGTGAIRAHRYPERYGPRSAYGGRPRQSRARGLARAVLETLPIVKFGQPQNSKPDPALELESAPGSRGRDVVHDAHHLSTIPEDAEAQPKPQLTPKGVTTAEAAGAADGNAGASDDVQGDEHLGCSICTEDFTVGEDVRVLPCDHKFHPQCVDPWLMNVSGTCPLCRLDLRPSKEDSASHNSADADHQHLPPPLEAEAEGEADGSSSSARRRSSRLIDLHRLRHATAEERIEALRRYRSEAQSQSATAENDDDQRRSARLTKRLREKFRIRTRAQSPSRSGTGSGPEAAGTATSSTR